MTRLHADQIDTSVALVQRLVADQFPAWADLPVRRVEEFGTDHHLYRLGDVLVARLPIIGWAVDQAREDAVAAPAYGGRPVWLHGDLMSGNLLLENGRLSAVIDWGTLGTGDQAPDLCPAFWLFDGESREVWRASLEAVLDDFES